MLPSVVKNEDGSAVAELTRRDNNRDRSLDSQTSTESGSSSTSEEGRLKKLFESCDDDKDGFLNRDNFAFMCKQLSLDEWTSDILDQLGVKCTSRISFQDFLKFRAQALDPDHHQLVIEDTDTGIDLNMSRQHNQITSWQTMSSDNLDMLRYALVLFDEDGCTAVVESSKIRSDTEVQTSLQCTLCLSGKQYKVEVLELSDSKVELNSFENTWSKSHRSRALDAAKRGGQIGGYLSVWPEDAETEEPQNSGSDGQDSSSEAENEGKQSRKRRKTESKRMVKEKKKSDKKPKKTSKSQGTSAVTDNNTDTQQSTTITGTNSRKITVLYEGSGDYNGQDPKLERPPFYTFHLSQDQTDTLLLQVEDHTKGNRTFGCQTTKVAIFENDDEVLSLVEREDSSAKETDSVPIRESDESGQSELEKKCECVCGKVMKAVEENSAKLDRLNDMLAAVMEKMDEKFESSLISVSLLDSLGMGIPSDSVPPAGKEKPSTILPTPAALNTLNDDHLSEEEDEVPKIHDVFTAYRTNLQVSPKPTFSLSDVQSQGQRRCFTSACSKGPILEVSSAAEVPVGDVELRVQTDLQRKTKLMSCSMGNFGWLLAKQLFSKEEMVGKNYHGRKGKNNLSPRRVHAIEHAAVDMYGEGDNIKHLANAVNTGIRNCQRQPLRLLFGI